MNLSQYVVERARPRSSPYVRNSAIGAIGIASVLYFDKGACVCFEIFDGKFRSLFIRKNLLDEQLLICIGDDVGDLRNRSNRVTLALYATSSNDYPTIWVLPARLRMA